MGRLRDWLDKVTDPESIPQDLETLDLVVSVRQTLEKGGAVGAAVEAPGFATPVPPWGAGAYEFMYGIRN